MSTNAPAINLTKDHLQMAVVFHAPSNHTISGISNETSSLSPSKQSVRNARSRHSLDGLKSRTIVKRHINLSKNIQ